MKQSQDTEAIRFMHARRRRGTVTMAAAGMLALAGCGNGSLAQTCQDYYEFDQTYSPQTQEAIAVGVSPASSDEDVEAMQALMQDARANFDTIVDESEDESFVAEAQQVQPMFEVFETLTDPEVSDVEKIQVAESTDLDSAIEAEENLVAICESEIN